jgi:hypothetical protein
MAKLTVSQIRALYEAIQADNRVLPNFDEIDFETKWFMIELLQRSILGIDTEQGADEGKSVEEQITDLKNLLKSTLIYDQSGFYIGQPEASRLLFPIRVVTPFLLPANCAGSIAFVGVAPFTTATFSIKKNGFQIGTFTFPAGVSSATFASVETTFVAGDELQVYAPAVKDDDLEDPRWTFKINYIKEV